jgi:hypothetical protein
MANTDNCVEQSRQRQLAQEYTPPFPRFDNLSEENNPYRNNPHNYTKFDFDMRRKAEVLKYNSNKMSTQTNSLTKQQKFALLMRGAIPSVKTQPQQCPLIATPSSSSGVPGPPIYLYEDPSVDLYNYATGNRSFAFNVETRLDPTTTITITDISLGLATKTHVAYFKIENTIDQPRTTYTIQIPIGVEFSGTSKNTNTQLLQIPNILLNVYYNTTVIYSIYTSYSFILSFSCSQSETPFYVNAYLGVAEFNDIQLYTIPGYIYKFEVMLPASTTGVSYNQSGTLVSPGISKIQYYANTQMDSIKTVNCTAANYTTNNMWTINPGFSITSL